MITSPRRVRLASSSPNELAALLAPVSPERFAREYWGKKPLFVKGFEEKYAGFFDAAAFSDALKPGPVAADFLRASFDRKTSEGTSALPSAPDQARSTAFRATLDQAVALFDAGATLCVSQIETRVASLVPFLAAIKKQLGYPCRVSFNAYLSPPGSGYNWHFDSRVASTLQIEGTKRWRYSNAPAIAWPRANGTIRADGVIQYADPSIVAQDWERFAPFDEKDTTEVLLEPGDLLILPAGVWHEACGGSGGSLALNLAFTPIAYGALIAHVLDVALGRDAAWRGPSPVLPAADDANAQSIAEISQQLGRAAKALQSVAADPAAIAGLWQNFSGR